ncbi:hypothetical protein BD408DRAFT_432673 [Parasitella parasitica]|nr:hypothetical protein BD408DRAFT_432673 [Parasitella parasitica]
MTQKAARVFFQHVHVPQTFVYCWKHSSSAEEMMLQHILPTSPSKPKSGVSFTLLKEIRNFIPVASWVEYLNESNSAPKNSILGDILFEYTRLILYCEEYVNDTFQLDFAPRCGACQGADRLKISMDENFTLKKFKTRGQDVHTYPLIEEDQLWPDPIEILSKYEGDKMPEKDLCVSQVLEKNRFQAGNDTRKSSNSPDDVPGVFMGACARHALPKVFFDIDQGEK